MLLYRIVAFTLKNDINAIDSFVLNYLFGKKNSIHISINYYFSFLILHGKTFQLWHLIFLFTRPSNHDYTSECVDKWSNNNIQELLENSNDDNDGQNFQLDLMLQTSPTYSCRSGDIYRFGKCTYTPLVEQTDKGYSKFYSILYHMVSQIHTHIHTYIHANFLATASGYAHLAEPGCLCTKQAQWAVQAKLL